MTDITRMLFGVDQSDFSREALLAVGELVARHPNFHMTIFHGAPDPRIILSKFCHLKEADVEDDIRELNGELQDYLEKAKKALIQAGHKEENTSAIFQERCSDPAGAILDMAEADNFNVIGVARFGASSTGHHAIGSIPYRLACASEKCPLWIVDHRSRSRNILVCLQHLQAPDTGQGEFIGWKKNGCISSTNWIRPSRPWAVDWMRRARSWAAKAPILRKWSVSACRCRPVSRSPPKRATPICRPVKIFRKVCGIRF